MGASHRGYVSFLLFSQLSFLLLLPFLIPHSDSSASLAGAYAADSAYREHISFKRAIKSCAMGALDDLQNGIVAPQLAVAADSPVLSKAKPFGDLLHSEQEQALRIEAIRRWIVLEAEWGEKTEFDTTISCGERSSLRQTAPELYLRCAPLIRLSEDSQSVLLEPGINAQVLSRTSQAGASSALKEGRLQ